MSKILFLCDVDGCVAPMPWKRSIAAGTDPSELDFALGNVRWETRFLSADPVTHFTPDRCETVAFDDGFKVRDLRVYLSSEMLARLAVLAQDPVVDFRWLSMWNEQTQGVFTDLVGFRAPFVQTRNQQSEMYEHFKGWAVAELFEAGYACDALVWLDDQHNARFVNWSAAEGVLEPGYPVAPKLRVPSLVVRVDGRYGISRAELARVEGFVREHA